MASRKYGSEQENQSFCAAFFLNERAVQIRPTKATFLDVADDSCLTKSPPSGATHSKCINFDRTLISIEETRKRIEISSLHQRRIAQIPLVPGIPSVQ